MLIKKNYKILYSTHCRISKHIYGKEGGGGARNDDVAQA